MKHIVVAVGLSALLLAGTAQSGEAPQVKPYPSKEESAGMLGGAAIGALAGGPFGFVIGLALGGWIGDRMDNQKQTSALLSQQLEEKEREAQALNSKLEESDRTVEALSMQLESSRARLVALDEGS